MSTTPPEASTEYSRGGAPLSEDSAPAGQRSPRARHRPGTGIRGPVGGAILAGTMVGALLLLVAEFTTLFEVRTAVAAAATVRSVGTGSHHGYALVPVALLVSVFGYAVWRSGSRPALLAVGALGVLSLLVALLADLPDTNATGLVLSAGHYVQASSRPSAGFYMETLGAVVLVITCVSAFLLIGSPESPRPRRTKPRADQPAG